jgi:cohesin complex subunit SA-1/2
MLFRPIADNPADAKSAPARKVLSLTMDDAVQYRCAGAIQAAIERQTDYLDDDGSSDASSVLTDIENEADASRSKQQPKTSQCRWK